MNTSLHSNSKFASQVPSVFEISRYFYSDEISITWLSNPTFHPFVRERLIWCANRAAKPAKWRLPQNVLGHSNLRPDAKPEHPCTFLRRCWFRAAHDEIYGMNGHGPYEAVDPRSIRVGQPSRKPRILDAWPLILYRDDEWPDLFHPNLENWGWF